MKQFYFFCLLLLCLKSNAKDTTLLQRAQIETNPAALAHYLTAGHTKELDKVRAIFHWITDNISYNTIIFQKRSRYQPRSRFTDDQEDTSMVLKPLDVRVAEGVLKRRVAVCDGYSRLFKTLCDFAGIKSVIIYGYARSYSNRVGTRFSSNHTWNAVLIDNKWELLDATWASGYINFNDDFVKSYNDNYFLTPPQQFIQDHYPESIEWSLLMKPPTVAEFRYSPFKNQSFVKHGISSYAPSTGIIEARIGDTIRIEIVTDSKEKNLLLSAHPLIENGLLSLMNPFQLPTSFTHFNNKKVIGNYIVHMPMEWLYVIWNGETILRYKVKLNDPIPVANLTN